MPVLNGQMPELAGGTDVVLPVVKTPPTAAAAGAGGGTFRYVELPAVVPE
jgi:hypothetical protein